MYKVLLPDNKYDEVDVRQLSTEEPAATSLSDSDQEEEQEESESEEEERPAKRKPGRPTAPVIPVEQATIFQMRKDMWRWAELKEDPRGDEGVIGGRATFEWL